jgi:hypothetical protein
MTATTDLDALRAALLELTSTQQMAVESPAAGGHATNAR